MKYKFPNTDIELEFQLVEDEMHVMLYQMGVLLAKILVDKADLSKAFKNAYFK